MYRSGVVLRIGKAPADDLKEAGKVGGNRGVAMDVAAKILFVAPLNGNLEKWSVPDFERQEAIPLPKRAFQLYYEPKSKILFSALDNKKDRDGSDLGGVGNIVLYNLK